MVTKKPTLTLLKGKNLQWQNTTNFWSNKTKKPKTLPLLRNTTLKSSICNLNRLKKRALEDFPSKFLEERILELKKNQSSNKEGELRKVKNLTRLEDLEIRD
ncbi:hypothetical protein TESG_08376 [Trichophyton tonsurans CBS 112818]|uniref:Uncharacterized protein n=1 Tax=Trichophyton tonsurans (strain CBS 112818) TaxID=647933 RepID=F2RVE7_TRIT1|nr:hypothetical protein TESG_08376 [Trichophyton tonsurans CBS 112818]